MSNKIFASFTSVALFLTVLGSAPAQAADTKDYIVMFKAGTSSDTQTKDLNRVGAKVKIKYKSVALGAAVQLTAGQAKLLASDSDVALVEIDGIVTTFGSQINPPSWGLDRIDQANLPLNGAFNYSDSGGSGVTIFVVDTGLAVMNDLGTRTIAGFTAINDGRGTIDCNGHGTHVAGTAAGTNYGVAKLATVIPVRVLDCRGSGANSGVIAGLDWVKSNYSPGTKAVVNLSLGGGASVALDTAVNNLINAGVSVVVAAGNATKDACNYSPARVPNALTIGATSRTDAIAPYSNYGKCVDLFAPGSEIVSSNLAGGSVSYSGTSMASPHAAGVAALILGASSVYLSPTQVATALGTSATSGKIKFSRVAMKSTANKLLFAAQ